MTVHVGRAPAIGLPGALSLDQPGGGVGVSIVCMENVFTETAG